MPALKTHIALIAHVVFSLCFIYMLACQEPTSRIEQFQAKRGYQDEDQENPPKRKRGPGRPKARKPKSKAKAKAKAEAKAASKPKQPAKAKATAKSKAKAKAKGTKKVPTDSQATPPRTPSRPIANQSDEHSAPKVEGPKKRPAPKETGGPKVAKVAVSFARRNPPAAARALLEWTAIKNAFGANLGNYPKRSKNEDHEWKPSTIDFFNVLCSSCLCDASAFRIFMFPWQDTFWKFCKQNEEFRNSTDEVLDDLAKNLAKEFAVSLQG